MRVIACVDDNGGMMFNQRRQSRDRILVADIVEMTAKQKLWMNEYSAQLFASSDEEGMIDEEFLRKAGKEDFCFVENQSVQPYLDRVNEIIIYRWNRKYPYDFCFDVNLQGWKMIDKKEFQGASHEKITREVYRRGEEQ